ncbi:MAG: phage holin family protein [Anaerolineae bacterium]|nr:phage holin family protein [Thermoflexales bacterium]MDW8052933.1 phage holin family protein [Anaerolineae bacterium]MDW8291584.1 phage holin family protein [Anaerolineae bacterium]
MRKFFLRLGVNAAVIFIAAAVLPGIHVRDESGLTYLLLGILFGVLNATVKPLLKLLTCPLILLTLGLFILVINGVILLLVSALSGGALVVDGLGTAILGGVVMSLANIILEVLLGLRTEED